MKRYCICVFYDKDRIVRDYFTYYIEGLQKVCDKILVVVNGGLNADEKCKLEKLGIDLLIRENRGLDFGVWKVAIEKVGYEEIAKYDELILTNNTCYGPIFPIDEMFNEMSNRNCDFWGITKHPSTNNYIIKHDKKTKIIEHIQSYFLVFKKHVFLSDAFKNYWKKIKFYNDYNKVVGYYETKLTKYFEDNGFKSSTYVNIPLNKDFIINPMFITDLILNNIKLPFIKRKLFIENYYEFSSQELPYHTKNTLKFIENHTNYNTNLIWDDILQTQPMSKIISNLNLNYILSSVYPEKSEQPSKTALILYIYYEDNVEYCLKYVASMPEESDIYIISSKQTTLDKCKKSDLLKNYNVTYRLKNNRGRDVSAYLITAKDVFDNYDIICCVHDKKTPQISGIYGYEFQQQCFECCLKNKIYVQNIINTFKNNPKLGMLCPPPIIFANTDAINNGMGPNMPAMKKLFKMLKLNVPFDYEPIGTFGSMFWIKSHAIKPLFRHEWKYEDFPEEPLSNDGSISHAIERIYPAVAQEAGYYSGWISPDTFASMYSTLLINTIKTAHEVIYKKFGLFTPISILKNPHLKLDYKKYYKKCKKRRVKYFILSKLFKNHKKFEYYNKKYQNAKLRVYTAEHFIEKS